MKKPASLILAFTLCFLLSVGAFADTGPKPSVHVKLQNLPEGPVYGTLLSKSESTGPASYDPDYEPQEWDSVQDIAVWRAFQGYEDADGFYFLNELWDCSEGELAWTYYPPREFKLLLYFPESGEWSASGAYGQYAFDSYFAADLSESGTIELTRSYDYGGEALGLIARVVITLAIELLLALAFGYRTKGTLKVIALMNLATQLGMSIALNVYAYFNGASMGALLLAEALVTAVETAGYCCELPRRGVHSRGRAAAYAVFANICSLAAGLLLGLLLPELNIL